MATGRHTQLTKQVGEYIVAAEVCRRGYIATTFTGNVPHYDIIASNESGRHQAIQVKTIASRAWQFDIRKFSNVRLSVKRQIMGRRTQPPYQKLICVFVRLESYGADDFYILTWEDLQSLIVKHYRTNLASHGGCRPKKHDSFHCAILPELMTSHLDKWNVLEKALRGGI